MDWEEVVVDDDGLFEDVDYKYDDPSDIDAFFEYWALQADPRYREGREAYEFEMECYDE